MHRRIVPDAQWQLLPRGVFGESTFTYLSAEGG